MTTQNKPASGFSVYASYRSIGNDRCFPYGKWFDLTEFNDKDDFIDYAKEQMIAGLGGDDGEFEWSDDDLELVFTDYELAAFKDYDLISESDINSNLWDLMEMDADDLEMLEAYIAAIGAKMETLDSAQETLEEAQDCYAGTFSSDEEFARGLMDDIGALIDLEPLLEFAIDWSIVARGLTHDYYSYDGYYFNAS